MSKSNVINFNSYFKNKRKISETKESEQYECDSYEDFISIVESYYKADSKEYAIILETYEETKNRLTQFYLSTISSIVDNSNNLSTLYEDSFVESIHQIAADESDMATNYICEREACCLTLHLLWIMQKER